MDRFQQIRLIEAIIFASTEPIAERLALELEVDAVLGQRRVGVLAVVRVDRKRQQLLDGARPPALGHREFRVEVPRFVAFFVLHVDDELFRRHAVAALACSACLAKSGGERGRS